jgi:hypothetical protein
VHVAASIPTPQTASGSMLHGAPSVSKRLKNALARISSFEKKPASGGMPAIASVAMSIVARVDGMYFARPPIFFMSCSPEQPWMTDPEPRKRHALKNACVIRWKIAAVNAPTPAATNMKPSCETVE